MTDVAKALRQAFNLGQTYWQQADSESRSQWRKSDETRAKFEALVIETLAELDAVRATPAPGAPAGFKLVPIEATPEMVTAGGQTPGIRAIDGASAEHQLRGNPLPAEAFATGSPLAQAWCAMLDAAPGAPGQEAAAVLIAFAEGRVHHINAGLCPDEVSGFESRDPACPVCAALHPKEAAAVQAVGAWQDIATAPDGVLVIVGWRDKEDAENPDRHMFDYREEGVWANYFSEHEHYSIAGVTHGLSEDAPYTHWMPMGPIPAALPAGAGEKTS